MRLLLAGLFVFGSVLLAIGLLSDMMEHGSPILFGLGMGILVIVLCIIALIVFNLPLTKGKDAAEQLKNMEEKGMIVSSDFRAVRAFQVEELEDEGPHYFVELADGAVLYLNDQALYTYEPIDDDPENNQPRSFPCSDFTIRRHHDEGWIAEIICRGHILEPESVEPAFQGKDYRQGKVPEDGDIIMDRTYDQIKEGIAGTK